MRIFSGFIFLLILISCSNNKPAGDLKDDMVIKFAIHTNGDTSKVQSIRPICEYLSKKLNIRVIPDTPQTELQIIDKFRKNEIHLAVMGAFGYIAAADDTANHVRTVAVYGTGTKPNTYNSCMITHPSSDINNLNDVKAKSKTLTLMGVNPNSTSGHIYPRLFLMGAGFQQLESDFKEISFAGSHTATIKAIIDKKADLGICAYSVLQNEIENKRLTKDAVKTVWISDEIVVGPIVMNNRLPKDLQDKIEEAFVNLSKDSPETWNQLKGKSAGVAEGASGFIKSKDSDYDIVRKSISRMEDLMMILEYYNN